MLDTMAKKRPKAEPDPLPSEKAVLYIEIDPYIKRAMDELARRHNRKLTGEVTQALQEYLQKHSRWPPQPQD